MKIAPSDLFTFTAPQIAAPQLSEPPPSFICPITSDIMTDPVIDKHGHSFERKAISDWLKIKNTCPMNQEPLTLDDLAPNRALKETIESYRAQGSQAIQRGVDEKDVPQPHGQNQNDQLAKPLLIGAQDLEKTGQLVDAEKLYLMALQFTSKSEDYAHLPRLFEKKGEKERAASSYVVLANLQMTEGKQTEAIATLKKSLELVAHPSIKEKLGNVLNNSGKKHEAAILFLELAQQALYNKNTHSAMRLCRLALEAFPGHAETWKTMAAMQHESSETLKMLLKGANEPSMPIKERIELCRMVSIKEPEHLQAKLLFLELNQLKMKDKIKRLKQEMKERLPPALVSISKAEWAAPHLIKNLPPYPQELKDFLAGDCTIWPGKKRSETHIVVPLFPQVDINGWPAPSTLDSLDQLDKSSGGPGFRYVWDQIPKNTPAEKGFHYAVMTNDVIPGSRNRSYKDQIRLLPAGYEAPEVLDAARAILWENRRSGIRCFNNSPETYTRCKEEINDYHLVVGGFAPSGLFVINLDGAFEYIGVAGWRKF